MGALDFVKRHRLIIVSAAVVLIIVIFWTAVGGQLFRPEPKPADRYPDLPKTATAERQPFTGLICKNELDGRYHEAYDRLDTYVNYGYTEEFTVDGLTMAEFDMVLSAYLNDHPGVFWLSENSVYSYYEYDGGVDIELNFEFSGDGLDEAKRRLDEAVDKAFAYVPDTADDLAVETYINDYLVNHCEYDAAADYSHSVYGALVNKKAVCDGYSKAFQLLCAKMGVAAAVREGTSDFNEDSADRHMWNIVRLNGDWYNVDVTWNDSDKAQSFSERYFYMNVTDSQISKDHKAYPLYKDSSGESRDYNIFQPECKSDSLDYLKICCATIADLNRDDEPVAAIIDAAKKHQNDVTFVIAPSLDYKETADKIIHDGYAYQWIETANRYCADSEKLDPSASALVYPNRNAVTLCFRREKS